MNPIFVVDGEVGQDLTSYQWTALKFQAPYFLLRDGAVGGIYGQPGDSDFLADLRPPYIQESSEPASTPYYLRGLYRITSHVVLSVNASGERFMRLSKYDGNELERVGSGVRGSSNNYSQMECVCFSFVSDYLDYETQIQIFQDSGSTLEIVSSKLHLEFIGGHE